MDDIKIRVIDSKKLIEAINTGSYEINLSTVMALGAVMLDTKKDPDEWCMDCKEYDQGKHSCPRWNRVITHTVEDLRAEAQPGQRNARVFQGIIVEYPSISAYPEYEGKPYFSIKYTENGQEFFGYGTYNPEVLSEYLKNYFMPSTQPGWTTDIKDILAYLDGVVHPLVSPENWNVYSELHDMVSGLLKPWEGEQE